MRAEDGGVLAVPKPEVPPPPPVLLEVVTVVDPVGLLAPPPGPDDVVVPLCWRLWQKREFWRETLGASKFVMEIIDDGYRLPFIKPPPRVWRSNNSLTETYSEFVTDFIAELVRLGCMVEVRE